MCIVFVVSAVPKVLFVYPVLCFRSISGFLLLPHVLLSFLFYFAALFYVLKSLCPFCCVPCSVFFPSLSQSSAVLLLRSEVMLFDASLLL